jgi:hypothetical protein
MAREYPVVDLNKGNVPDIAELAEEVYRTRQPRVIRRADEDLAVIAPVRKKAKVGRRPTPEDVKAFESAFGAWTGVDLEAFLRANEESRRLSTRPLVEL